MAPIPSASRRSPRSRPTPSSSSTDPGKNQRRKASALQPSGDEAVTDARLVDDQRRPRRLGLELLTQRADRDAKIFDLPLLHRAPDRPQQLGMRQHPAPLLGELREDRIFLGRQMNRFAIPGDGAIVKVDANGAGLDRLLTAVGSKVGEIFDITIELQHFGSNRGDRVLVAPSTASKLANRAADRGQAGTYILGNRGQQRRS